MKDKDPTPEIAPVVALSLEERAEKAYTAWAAYQSNHILGLPARTFAQLSDGEKGAWVAAIQEI